MCWFSSLDFGPCENCTDTDTGARHCWVVVLLSLGESTILAFTLLSRELHGRYLVLREGLEALDIPMLKRKGVVATFLACLISS